MHISGYTVYSLSVCVLPVNCNIIIAWMYNYHSLFPITIEFFDRAKKTTDTHTVWVTYNVCLSLSQHDHSVTLTMSWVIHWSCWLNDKHDQCITHDIENLFLCLTINLLCCCFVALHNQRSIIICDKVYVMGIYTVMRVILLLWSLIHLKTITYGYGILGIFLIDILSEHTV